MEMPQYEIKAKMQSWVNGYLHEKRLQGKVVNRARLAKVLGCSSSSLSQYTNPECYKKAPWEFQLKLCCLVGRTMFELHPELHDIRLMHE
tara:strand:+ start:1003 stop:1272 length:270 start_codon:yes stop_codon:yes gene_type:complete